MTAKELKNNIMLRLLMRDSLRFRNWLDTKGYYIERLDK